MSELATLGGGCFWCLEAVFEQLKGVEKVVSGYTGGSVPDPTYHQVCGGRTGHAEVIQVIRPAIVTFQEILDVFFATHDPTTKNRQGADVARSIAVPSSMPRRSRRKPRKAYRRIERRANLAADRHEVVPLESSPGRGLLHQGYFRGNRGRATARR